MKPTSNPISKNASSAGSTPTHVVQEHKGLCILALPASFRRSIPTKRWNEIHRELHAQVLELIERLPAAVHFVAMPLCVAQITGDIDPAEIGQRLTQEEPDKVRRTCSETPRVSVLCRSRLSNVPSCSGNYRCFLTRRWCHSSQRFLHWMNWSPHISCLCVLRPENWMKEIRLHFRSV